MQQDQHIQGYKIKQFIGHILLTLKNQLCMDWCGILKLLLCIVVIYLSILMYSP